MTPLAERLRERIDGRGPVTFRDWMEAALYDEREGYYRRADLARWGPAGDYRTAPERTPLFAATFARDFAPRVEFRRLGEGGDGELGVGLVFTNELLDALPAHRVRQSRGRLRELF